MSNDLAPDWILQQTLAIQKKANVAWLNTKPEIDDGGLTLTVLGCGTMGTAILGGILESLAEADKDVLAGHAQTFPRDGSSAEPPPRKVPSRFNACVRSRRSAERVRKELARYNARLTVHTGDILLAVKEADIVLLCCEPDAITDILHTDGIVSAIDGKLLISVCGGVTERRICDVLYGHGSSAGIQKCTIVRAMPNIAAAIRESMTVVATSDPPLPEETDRLITWIFTRIGKVRRVQPSAMDVCTALCGSGPAFAALMMESMANSAIGLGLPAADAHAMAAQAVRGSSGLLLQGEHPAMLRDRISTPGGGTIEGLLKLEEEGFRTTITKAMRESTAIVGNLGSKK